MKKIKTELHRPDFKLSDVKAMADERNALAIVRRVGDGHASAVHFSADKAEGLAFPNSHELESGAKVSSTRWMIQDLGTRVELIGFVTIESE